MDDRRFDQLVKSFASARNRRSVLKGILGLGGAALAGGTLLEGDTDAARRPTPTPTPVRCPGKQTWNGSACICKVPPAPGTHKCGPDCCTGVHGDPPSPTHSECCDNACCFGTCTAEEVCCPTNPPAGGGDPIANVCANGDCCLLPNVCRNGVCGPPPCRSDGDCETCETCDLESGTCVALCGGDTPQCCTNRIGSYCIPEGRICCAWAEDCTAPCSYCNDEVWYCVDRCASGGTCCESPSGDQCCDADQCVTGQGCCPEGFVACGGSCCNTTAHYCNAEEQCVCNPGTVDCGELPGECCPEGQCNDDRFCCADGSTACGSDCCDTTSEVCYLGSCVCVEGYLACNGVCAEVECCNSDKSACASLGFDLECVACSGGVCASDDFDYQPCDSNNGWCSNGLCMACLSQDAPCTYDAQCCHSAIGCFAGYCRNE